MKQAVRFSLFTSFLFALILAQSAFASEIRSVWIWGSTVRSMGAENVAADLRQHGITDAILLVKGTAGTVAYPSAIAPNAAPGIDTLGPFLAACHARGIKVHAWLMYNQDDYFGITRTSKKYTIWHVATPARPNHYPMNDGRICPLRAKEEYNQYTLSIINEILQNYDVDGIHLDAIRYAHAVYCFCPAHVALAAAQGIDMAHVNDLMQKTFYTPADQQTFFNAFATGDPDAVGWVNTRTAEIGDMVASVRSAVRDFNESNRRKVALSAALMPEGALLNMVTSAARSDQFALCHYAQSYPGMAPMLDFLAPMSYHKDYGQPPAWVGTVTAGAVTQVAPTPVVAGIQTYGGVTATELGLALSAARWNGAAGFALFRYGVSTTGDNVWKANVPTFQNLLDATQAAFDAGWIDSPAILNSLMQKLKDPSDSTTPAARNRLMAFINELNAQAGKHIVWGAANNLAAQAQWVYDLMP